MDDAEAFDKTSDNDEVEIMCREVEKIASGVACSTYEDNLLPAYGICQVSRHRGDYCRAYCSQAYDESELLRAHALLGQDEEAKIGHEEGLCEAPDDSAPD